MGRRISLKHIKVRGFKRVQRDREREKKKKRGKEIIWGNRSRIMDGEERIGKGNKEGNQLLIRARKKERTF